MSFGLSEQIEHWMDYRIDERRNVVKDKHDFSHVINHRCMGRTWFHESKEAHFVPVSRSRKFMKKMKHRAERQRARQDIECLPMYGCYAGWEW